MTLEKIYGATMILSGIGVTLLNPNIFLNAKTWLNEDVQEGYGLKASNESDKLFLELSPIFNGIPRLIKSHLNSYVKSRTYPICELSKINI